MSLKAADSLTPLTRESAEELKRLGIEAVFRYLKDLAKEEVAIIHAAGLGLGLIYETTPTHASYFSKTKGVSDAREALKQANALGAPSSTVLIHTVDYDAAERDLPVIDEYVDGVHSEIGDRTGLYGGYLVISHVKKKGVIKWLMQTYGWSYGSIESGIELYQHENDVRLAGIDIDLDELYTRDGLWWPAASSAASVNEPELKLGAKGAAVETLQKALNSKADAKLVEDGDFGSETEAAVKRFQQAHHLESDGVVGPQTWSALK